MRYASHSECVCVCVCVCACAHADACTGGGAGRLSGTELSSPQASALGTKISQKGLEKGEGGREDRSLGFLCSLYEFLRPA